MTHSPEHLFEKPTLLSAFFRVLLFWAISWALLGARQKMGALFWGLIRVHLLSRAFFWVGLLSRALFWGLFRGLSVHQNLNAYCCWNKKKGSTLSYSQEDICICRDHIVYTNIFVDVFPSSVPGVRCGSQSGCGGHGVINHRANYSRSPQLKTIINQCTALYWSAFHDACCAQIHKYKYGTVVCIYFVLQSTYDIFH